ncbi:MAG: hypothetical protein ACRDCA_00085 [Serratia sp. (in: enterobacteria)]|uniref:hypothetical protein n=1 Tax=Serratia sp. (in: enterobacteria) TaxID=616 RepID=UPI003F3EC9CE
MSIPMPTLKSVRRGRQAKGISVIDADGRIYVLYSVRRFAEMLGIPRESFYALNAGKMQSLYGMKIYTGDLAGLVEGKDFFVVNDEDEME